MTPQKAQLPTSITNNPIVDQVLAEKNESKAEDILSRMVFRWKAKMSSLAAIRQNRQLVEEEIERLKARLGALTKEEYSAIKGATQLEEIIAEEKMLSAKEKDENTPIETPMPTKIAPHAVPSAPDKKPSAVKSNEEPSDPPDKNKKK